MRRTFALLLFACFAPSARADPLDDWCKTVRLPSSIAICSEPELRALTRARQTAYDEARDQLSPDQQRVLLADQNDWVKSYPAGCGISQSAPPTLPSPRRPRNAWHRPGEPGSLICTRTALRPHRGLRSSLRRRPRCCRAAAWWGTLRSPDRDQQRPRRRCHHPGR